MTAKNLTQHPIEDHSLQKNECNSTNKETEKKLLIISSKQFHLSKKTHKTNTLELSENLKYFQSFYKITQGDKMGQY